jgi:hypothetical protein
MAFLGRKPSASKPAAKTAKPKRTPKPKAPALPDHIQAEVDAYHADPSDVIAEQPPTARRTDHDDEW